MYKGGCLDLLTYEHEVITPGVNTSICETLLRGNSHGCWMICDAQVRGPGSQIVEGACRVGFDPADGEGFAPSFLDAVVYELVGESAHQTRLTGSTGGDAKPYRGVVFFV